MNRRSLENAPLTVERLGIGKEPKRTDVGRFVAVVYDAGQFSWSSIRDDVMEIETEGFNGRGTLERDLKPRFESPAIQLSY
jgi:hypothetical protein